VEDLPVTLGLAGFTEAGEEIIKDYFLSQGSKEKTIKALVKAMNAGGGKIDSALQLRKKLKLTETGVITEKDVTDELYKSIKFFTPSEILKEFDSLGINKDFASKNLYSFNGDSFDVPMLKKWVQQFSKDKGVPKSGKGKTLYDIFSNSSSTGNDILKIIKEALVFKNSHGSIASGDSIIKATSDIGDSMIKDTASLQRFVSLLFGEKSATAHSSASDAANTLDVASYILNTELLEAIADELEL
jgi:hypothetical protein